MDPFYRGELVKLNVAGIKKLYENYCDEVFQVVKPTNKEGFVTIRLHANAFEILTEDLLTLTETHVTVSPNNHNPITKGYSDGEEEEEMEEEEEEMEESI